MKTSLEGQVNQAERAGGNSASPVRGPVRNAVLTPPDLRVRVCALPSSQVIPGQRKVQEAHLRLSLQL